MPSWPSSRGMRQFTSLSPDSKSPSSQPRYIREAVVQGIKQGYTMLVEGFKGLYRNTRDALQLRRTIPKNQRNWHQVHFLAQNNRDWFLFLPFIIIFALPGSFLYLPPLITLYPDMLPSTFQIPEFKLKQLESLMDRRLTAAVFLLRSFNQIANEQRNSKSSVQI